MIMEFFITTRARVTHRRPPQGTIEKSKTMNRPVTCIVTLCNCNSNRCCLSQPLKRFSKRVSVHWLRSKMQQPRLGVAHNFRVFKLNYCPKLLRPLRIRTQEVDNMISTNSHYMKKLRTTRAPAFYTITAITHKAKLSNQLLSQQTI